LLLLDLIGGIGMATAEFWLLGSNFGGGTAGVMEMAYSVLSLVMPMGSAMLLVVLVLSTAALALGVTLLMVERRSF
jgi:hypothetical protein